MSDNENKTTLNGIDDSGKRMSYGEGKATREPSEGKGRYDLITPFGLARLAKWYELGAQMIQLLPSSYNQKRTVMMNYVDRNSALQRNNYFEGGLCRKCE